MVVGGRSGRLMIKITIHPRVASTGPSVKRRPATARPAGPLSRQGADLARVSPSATAKPLVELHKALLKLRSKLLVFCSRFKLVSCAS